MQFLKNLLNVYVQAREIFTVGNSTHVMHLHSQVGGGAWRRAQWAGPSFGWQARVLAAVKNILVLVKEVVYVVDGHTTYREYI